MGIFSGFGNHNDTDRIYGYFPELSGGDGRIRRLNWGIKVHYEKRTGRLIRPFYSYIILSQVCLPFPITFHLLQRLSFRLGDKFPDEQRRQYTHHAIDPIGHTVIKRIGQVLILIQHWECP